MRFARLLVPALALGCGACFTPPLLMEGQHLHHDDARREMPSCTRDVSITLVEDEVVLRGFYVPAVEGAPIVLHLPESGGSAGSYFLHYGELTGQLADLGFASLVVDYAGVGLSSGKRSVLNLRRDALAMWNAALELVDHDPSRVVVRATSIGTVAVALLLESGAEPGGVELLLPVRARTVAARFAAASYGTLVGWFARAVFATPEGGDLIEQLERSPTPLLVVLAEDEQLLNASEQDQVRRAVARSGGRVVRRARGHFINTILAHMIRADEIPFLIELGAVIEDPRAQRLEWTFARRLPERLDAEARAALFDLRDPAGELPLDLFEEFALPFDVYHRFGGFMPDFGPRHIAKEAIDVGTGHPERGFSYSFSVGGHTDTLELRFEQVYVALCERGLGEDDARRQFARLFLKVMGIPDRVRNGKLEVRVDGTWEELDLTTPATDLEPPEILLHNATIQ